MAGHGLTFRSVDLQNADDPSDATIWLDLWNPFEPAETRGEDLVIPEKPGQTPMTHLKHRLVLELRGVVKGVGGTAAERSESFYTASEALRAVMEADLAPGTLSWVSPYLGLPSGSQSLSARCVDAIGGEITNRMSLQRWTFRLVCVDDPPEWT